MQFVLDNLNIIIMATLFGIMGLIGLWCFITGIRRGTIRSITRLLTVVISAGLAIFAVSILSSTVLPMIEPSIKATVVDLLVNLSAEAADLVDASEDLVNYVVEVLTALAMPILFALVFLGFMLLTYPVYWILNLFVPKGDGVGVLSRFVGAGVSIVGALVIIICVMMPVTGYTAYATETYPVVMETGLVPEGVVPREVDAQVAAARNNLAVKTVNLCGGDILFKVLTKVGDTTATEEVDFIIVTVADTLPAVQQLMEDNANVADGSQTLNLDALNTTILPALDETSPRLKGIFVEVLHAGASKWKNGETFLGLNLDEMLGQYSSSADTLLDRLINSTSDSVTGDLSEFADSMVLLSRTYNYFLSVSDTQKTVDDLEVDLAGIIKDITPETAEILKDTITSDIIGSANVRNESVDTFVSLVGETLAEVASLPQEEKEKEAAAINQVVSYASKDRGHEIAPNELVDTLLESNVLSTKVEEIADANADPENTEKKEIKVSSQQKEQIDTYIDNMIAASEVPDAPAEDALTPEQKATLEALKNIIVVRTTSVTPPADDAPVEDVPTEDVPTETTPAEPPVTPEPPVEEPEA